MSSESDNHDNRTKAKPRLPANILLLSMTTRITTLFSSQPRLGQFDDNQGVQWEIGSNGEQQPPIQTEDDDDDDSLLLYNSASNNDHTHQQTTNSKIAPRAKCSTQSI
ncbi:hypothetical protein Cantr_07359 [Candida viswanathii]|uniref:Uncharacterized protein n=1 Tax=Candida viswanathii TaxID=5486 RepID=A0A367XZU6_9ASCO|nr:hypothetical protein Cantr_07359 [Candida viswanathii]